MSIKLYGKPVAEAIQQDLASRTAKLKSAGIVPRLAIMRAGERSDDVSYESRVLRICETVGIDAVKVTLDADVGEAEFEKKLAALNADASVHGILIFRPLPRQLDEKRISDMVAPEKDVDCMNPENLKKLLVGDDTAIAPCTPEAVIEILKFYGYTLTGKNVTIVNRSLVLGKPLALLFMRENATVTVCHSRTQDITSITASADIFVSGIGKARYFGADSVSEGTTVIDVGINFAAGQMCGDIDYDAVCDRVGAITPVPGGVGIVTSSVLLRHVVDAAESL